MIPPRFLDKGNLPPQYAHIISGEEADIIACTQPLILPDSSQPFNFRFDKFPPTGEPTVITQFYTNSNTAHVGVAPTGAIQPMQSARDVFGFVFPEGIQRLCGLYRLANIMTPHVVPVFGCQVGVGGQDGPILFDRDSTPQVDGIIQPPALYKGYINVPMDDLSRMVKTYQAMERSFQAKMAALSRVVGRTPTPADPDFAAIQQAQVDFQQTMGAYESAMIEKYHDPLIAALSEVAQAGFGIVHPGLNFGFQLDPADPEGKRGDIRFFELSSLPNYPLLIKNVKAIDDPGERQAAGEVLGEVIRLEERALGRIASWCDDRVVGKSSGYGRLPGMPFGRIPFPLSNIPQELIFDDGTLVRQWQRGLRSMLMQNRDILPVKDGDPKILDAGEILNLEPDHHSTHQRYIQQGLTSGRKQ